MSACGFAPAFVSDQPLCRADAGKFTSHSFAVSGLPSPRIGRRAGGEGKPEIEEHKHEPWQIWG